MGGFRSSLRWFAFLFVTACLATGPRPAQATNYTVTTTTDNIAVDGLISLREAITASNTDAVSGDAPAGSGDDDIDFDPALTSGGATTITLALGPIVITDNVTIAGPGCDLLGISAGFAHRVWLARDGCTQLMGSHGPAGAWELPAFDFVGGMGDSFARRPPALRPRGEGPRIIRQPDLLAGE